MAAPAESSMKDLNGKWVMNKTLSSDLDAMLTLQGIGWLTRRAISWATITLHIQQYQEQDAATSAAVTHIDIEQTATGGIKGTTELRTLDGVERPHSDSHFGDLRGRSEWVAAADGAEHWEALDDFLREGWEEGDAEAAGPEGETHLRSYVINDERGWTAEQIWGFALVEGVRYHTRRVVAKKGDQTLRVRLVYDFKGK